MGKQYEVNTENFIRIGETSEKNYRSVSDWFKRIGQCYAIAKKIDAYYERRMKLTRSNAEENDYSLADTMHKLEAVMLSKTAQVNRLGISLGIGEIMPGFSNADTQKKDAAKALIDWYRWLRDKE